MNLNILWYLLVAVLFIVYFFLDGMDFGVSMLFPFLGKSESEKRSMLLAVGPTWGASEVWLLTAGGAMFAAFPNWYATMFSGFYPALFILLLALIVRGVSIEFWDKAESETGRKVFTTGVFIGGFLPPLLLAVALTNLLQGIPLDENQNYTGTLFTLFSPFTVSAGLAALAFFVYHGAVFLDLKSMDNKIQGNKLVIKWAGLAACVLLVLTALCSLIRTNVFDNFLPAALAIGCVCLLGISYLLTFRDKNKISLILNALVIATAVGTLFAGMFPNVIVSSNDPTYSLTIYNASSTPYTLKIMAIITASVLPIVILYTVWSHWIFRKINSESVSISGEKNDTKKSLY